MWFQNKSNTTSDSRINLFYTINNVIQIYSGTTSSRVLNGELLYTNIPEVKQQVKQINKQISKQINF